MSTNCLLSRQRAGEGIWNCRSSPGNLPHHSFRQPSKEREFFNVQTAGWKSQVTLKLAETSECSDSEGDNSAQEGRAWLDLGFIWERTFWLSPLDWRLFCNHSGESERLGISIRLQQHVVACVTLCRRASAYTFCWIKYSDCWCS